MKRAILVGYFGKQNAGDDAFLNVAAWGAGKYLGADDIHAIAPSVPVTHGVEVHPLKLPKELRVEGFFNRLRLRNFLRRTRHVIFGGGSNFHTTKHMEEFMRIIRAAGAGPHFAVGVSLGPFKDAGAEKACAELLSLLDFVGLRDRASYDRALALAPPSTRVGLTFDIAPLLPMAAGFSPAGENRNPRTLAVSLCNHERFSHGDLECEARRVEIVADALRRCLRAGICENVLLVDMNSHPKYGDREVHAQLKELVGDGQNVTQIPYQGDAAATMRLLGGAGAVLAMRLHAAVFGFGSGIPVGIIAYHEKCHEWARVTGTPERLVADSSALDGDNLVSIIGELMQRAPGVMPALSVEDAVRASERNWQWLR
jgi:polysaccharide pyruvyl transferase WcaK-like protein